MISKGEHDGGIDTVAISQENVNSSYDKRETGSPAKAASSRRPSNVASQTGDDKSHILNQDLLETVEYDQQTAIG